MDQPISDLAATASYKFLHFPTALSQQDLHTGYLNKYPLTPYPTTQEINKQTLLNGKVSYAAGSDIGQSVKHGAFCHFMHTSSPSSLHRSPPLSLRVSSAELHRVLDSLMNQINWLEVAVQAGKGRAPSIYCNVVEKILQAQISQLIEAENNIKGRDRGDRDYIHVYDKEGEEEGEGEDDSDTEVEGSVTRLLVEGIDVEEDKEEDKDYEVLEEDEEEEEDEEVEEEVGQHDEADETEEDDSEYDSV